MTMLARAPIALLLAWAVLAPVASAEVQGAEGAPAVIGRFNGMLLDIMRRADELGYQGRFELAARAVKETFDVPFMAAKTIGSYWSKLDNEQRQRWVRAFEDFTVSSYADKFDGFSGESIEILGQKPASHETLVILTRLIRPDDDDVDLDYRMHQGDAGWRVVDIYSDGSVSEVALRRSEYAVVLKQGGIDRLIDAVSKKTAQRAAGRS
jgi:phospholipid transport system substrate-binding protein